MSDAAPKRPLSTVLDRLVAAGDDADAAVSVDDLLDRLGHASFTTLMLVPALLVVTPLSGIPGFSSFCGILIVSVAVQRLLGRPHIYLPGWLRRRSVSAGALDEAVERIRGPARWLDRHTRPRLQALAHAPVSTLAVALAGLCGALMPFLELVPFSSSILGTSVLLTALGLLTRDGLVMLTALVPLAAIGWIGVAALSVIG